jgi:flagellar hook protein FlgE
MYSGVSGLRNHQIRMDAIGNNIANVNTLGYKASRVNFQDALNQTFRGATAPSADGTRGGINAMQIGLGMNVAAVDILFTQGNLQNTGVMTDCAIQGDGFFILSDGMQEWYTRAGNFQMDENGNLVNPSNGLYVRGWMADTAGTINTGAPVDEIQIPVGQILAPRATTEIEFGGLLHPAINGKLGYPDVTIDDGLGNTAILHFTVTPDPTNFYQYTITATTTTPGAVINAGAGWTGTITLAPAGGAVPEGTVINLVAPALAIDPPGPGGPVAITLPTTVPPGPVGPSNQNGGYFDNPLAVPVGSQQSVASFNPVAPLVTTTRIYDSLGNPHTITTTISKTGINTWYWSAANELGMAMNNNTGTLSFDSTGKLTSGTPPAMQWGSVAPPTAPPPGANSLAITLDFSDIRQNAERPLAEVYISPTEITSPFQDGYPAGTLQSFTIDKNGVVMGMFSNGQPRNLAQIAMANFTNPGGLTRSGDTVFQESNNSGPAQVGAAGKNGRGLVTPGAIEMSNVDLSQEFTDMIVTERGFQSNSRIITTSDEMLQELVNLKR